MTASLALDGLSVGFPTGALGDPRIVSAVDGVSFTVASGEIFGLVGESGCGKSTLANAIMGLLPTSTIITGSARVHDAEVIGLSDAALRQMRGNTAAMVFQDASTSLDPTWPVGDQIAETIRAHQSVTRSEAKEKALALMTEVGLTDPSERYGDAPHRLSGGMRQRIVIAAALANNPKLLIADEPTTALDVTLQAQILQLIDRLRVAHNTAVLLITHDLGVIAQVCDRVGVMYAGQLVEVAPVAELFANPRHPYTRALLAARPGAQSGAERLAVIPGQVPDLSEEIAGCRFASRCPRRIDACAVTPARVSLGDSEVACWNLPTGGTE
ncbi:MAG: ABC transporter ATP-binding protein [Microbacteriaceae bacterium]|nr:ABC transporter ATP-binding protein [Microbacteriaceae bacterium]